MRRQQQKWICKEWCFFQFFTDRYLMEPNLLRINKRSINKILLRGIWVWVLVQCSQKMFRPFSPFLKASLFKSQASHSGCQAGATKKPSPFKCIHQAILVKSVFLTSKLGSQMCKDIFKGDVWPILFQIFQNSPHSTWSLFWVKRLSQIIESFPDCPCRALEKDWFYLKWNTRHFKKNTVPDFQRKNNLGPSVEPAIYKMKYIFI